MAHAKTEQPPALPGLLDVSSLTPPFRASEPAFLASYLPGPRESVPAFGASSIPSPAWGEPAFRASSLPSPAWTEPPLRASTLPCPSSRIPTIPIPGESEPSVSDPIRVGWTPEQAFAVARIQLKRGALEEATTLIDQACAAAPAEPQYRALRAWLRVERGELEPGLVADEIVATLTAAVRHQPTNSEVRLYRALVLQRLCRNEEARRDFEAVAIMDPGNRQAARALRRYERSPAQLRPRRA